METSDKKTPERAVLMWTCGESDPDYLHAMEA